MKHFFCLCLISSLFSFPAFSAPVTYEEQLEKCKTLFAGKEGSVAKIAWVACENDVKIKHLQIRVTAGEKKFEKELDRLKKELEITNKLLEQMKQFEEEKAKEEKTVSSQVVKNDSAKPKGKSQPMFMVVDQPGRYVAATWAMPDMASYLDFQHLGLNTRLNSNQNIPTRVVLLKNGMPIPVVHPGGGYNQFYGMISKSNHLSPQLLSGVDPSLNDNIVVSYQPGDKFLLLVLTPTGKMLQAPNMPPQVIWGNPKKFAIAGDVSQLLFGRHPITAITEVF